VTKIDELGTTQAATSNRRTLRRNMVGTQAGIGKSKERERFKAAPMILQHISLVISRIIHQTNTGNRRQLV
jgi:hypothetical protein